MARRTYEFVQVDVFTQTPLAGNPLAVFTDARGLSDSEMQALAREMNLSETTFILPRDAVIEAREGKTASWMVQQEVAKSDELVLIRQGVECRRPSELHVRAAWEGERVTNVRVGGHAVQILRGSVVL
jgi:predicted PhzF superfamily epimerase YddE/YHI9